MDGQGTTQESARRNQQAKAMYSKESVTTEAKTTIQQESAQEAKKEGSHNEKETASKGKVKDRGVGEGEFGK